MKPRLNPFVVASLAFVSAATLQAATHYWDGEDNTADADGGAGTWDNVTTNWNDAATAGSAVAWPSLATGDDDAVFGVAGGDVIIEAGGITANDITFTVAGYTISGEPLTLDASLTTPTIATDVSATISANLLGSGGLIKTGNSTLSLSGDNTGLSGPLEISGATSGNAGAVRINGSDAFGGISNVDIQANSSLQLGGATLPLGATISAAGGGGTSAPEGTIRGVDGTNVINGPVSLVDGAVRFGNIGSSVSMTFNGAVTAGTGSGFGFLVRYANSGGVIFTNSSNYWEGQTQLHSGSAYFHPGTLPATTLVTLANSSSAWFETNGTFTRPLGNAVGQIQMSNTTAGRVNGIGARGADLSVNFGGAGADVIWGSTTGFNPAILGLNSSNSDSKITLVNPLDLNGSPVALTDTGNGARVIQVDAATADLDGGMKNSSASAASVRKEGAGTLVHDPGTSHTLTISGLNTNFGTMELASGTINVNGSASTGKPDSATGFVVSRGGTFHLNGGNVNCTSGTYVFPAGNTGGGSSNFILDSGTFNADGREVLNAYGAAGTTTVNGGLFICNGFKVSQNTGVLNLNGGILRAVYLYNGGSTVNFNGGTLQAKAARADFVATSVTTAQIQSGGAVIDSNGFAITIPKVLTEDSGSTGGGLTKIGAGALTLSADNTYTGPTSVEAGSLLINGDHSAATGDASVSADAGLGGDGTINDATYESGAQFPWTVADWTAAPTLNAGAVIIDGELTVVVDDTASLVNFTDASATFTILSASSLTVDTPAALAVDASAFTSGTGTWAVQQDGNTLKLVYTAGATSGFTAWADAYAPGQSADMDHDNDGVSNGVEYFMGETGSTFTANPGVIAGKVTWPKDPAFIGTFKVQVSDTLALGSWTDIVPPDASIDETDPNQVVFTLPTGDPKKFARLNVVAP